VAIEIIAGPTGVALSIPTVSTNLRRSGRRS
jgi:hypothetical protein